MIIDAHSHWLPDEIIANAHFFSKAWGDVESQLEAMRRCGVQKALLLYPTTDAHLKLGSDAAVARIYNDAVAAIVRRHADSFIATALLPAGDARLMRDELVRCREELGFKAVTLASSYDGAYLDDKRFVAVFEEAARQGSPLFVHPQIVNPIGCERVQDPLLTPVIEYVFDTTMCCGKLLMSDVLKDFPNVNFIFSYFAGVTAHLINRFDATYQMLRGVNFVKDLGGLPSQYLKNIYVDTSGDTHVPNFLSALEVFGARHILWGSDWPAKKDVASSLQAVRDLPIGSDDKEAILGGNLSRLLQDT